MNLVRRATLALAVGLSTAAVAATAIAAPASAASTGKTVCSTWKQIGKTAVYERTCTHVDPGTATRDAVITVQVSARNVGAAPRKLKLVAWVVSGGRPVYYRATTTTCPTNTICGVGASYIQKGAHGTAGGRAGVQVLNGRTKTVFVAPAPVVRF